MLCHVYSVLWGHPYRERIAERSLLKTKRRRDYPRHSRFALKVPSLSAFDMASSRKSIMSFFETLLFAGF